MLKQTYLYGTSGDEVLVSITTSPDGKLYASGKQGNQDSNYGKSLYALQNDGTLTASWSLDSEFNNAHALTATDDAVYVGGDALGHAAIVKFDPARAGAILWKAFLDTNPESHVGALTHDQSGNVYAAGHYYPDGVWFNANAFISAIDPQSGNVRWTRTIDSGGYDVAYAVACSPTSTDIFVSGHY